MLVLNLTGVGRKDLLALIATLEKELAERVCLHKETQARCTDLLLELRAYRRSGAAFPGWHCFDCKTWNGEAKEKRTHCRHCGAERLT